MGKCEDEQLTRFLALLFQSPLARRRFAIIIIVWFSVTNRTRSVYVVLLAATSLITLGKVPSLVICI